MARRLPERIGGGPALEYSARTSLELTKAKLEGYGASKDDLVCVFPYIENSAARTYTGIAATAINGTKEGVIPTVNYRQGGLYFIWDGSSSFKASWTGSVGSVLVVEVFRYVDVTNPIDVAGAWVERKASAKDELASITTITPNTLQVIVTVSNEGTGLKGVPAGWTLCTSYSPHTIRRAREAEGETGGTTVEYTGASQGVALSFAIRGAPLPTLSPTFAGSSSLSAGLVAPIKVELAPAFAGAGALSTPLRAAPRIAIAAAGTSSLSVALSIPAPVVARPRPTKPPLGLDVEGTTADGDTFHWYSDSRRAGNRPQNMGFAKQRGEGWGPATVGLMRNVMRDYHDLNLLDNIRFVGKDGHVPYEGRVHDFARTNDPVQQFAINLIGWFATANFRRFSEIYIDRSLGNWRDGSTLRQAENIEASMTQPGEWSATNSPPAILQRFTRLNATSGSGPFNLIETIYDGRGVELGKLMFDVSSAGGVSSVPANWLILASLMPDEKGLGGSTHSEDFTGEAKANQVVEAGPGMKYARFYFRRDVTATADGDWHVVWEHPAVVGRHELQVQGIGEEAGIHTDAIMADIVERFTPLKWAGNSVSYPVSHAAFFDAQPVDALKSLNDLHLFEIGCRTDKEVYWRPADLTKYDWQVRTDDPGVRFTPLQGDSIESFANGVEVTFTDFWGNTVTLYPSDFAELRDESEANPANRHGDQLWTPFTVPYPCTLEDALMMGSAYLAEFIRPKAPGTITIAGGYIRDAAGHWQQCSKVNETETIALVNHPNDAPRLITALNWQPLQLQISVDNGYQLLEAYLTRLSKRREAAAMT